MLSCDTLKTTLSIQDGYDALAAAIVTTAIEDYIVHLINPSSKTPISQSDKHNDPITKLEKFFRSDYFAILTNIDPEILITKCKEYARAK